MNYIVITDIFGNTISDDIDYNSKLPFILIHTAQPYLLLEKVSKIPEVDGIWQLVLPTIFHTLYINKVNPDNFAPVGDIWLPSPSLPKELSILLVNTNKTFSAFPIDYIKLDSYTNFNIWKPLCPIGYQEIGLIASTTKPSVRAIKVINNKYLIEYNGDISVKGRNTNMNDFNLLSNIESKKYTIDRTKFLTNPTTIKIASKASNKFMTANDNNISINENNKKDDRDDQKISYTIQGELKMNNKCIGSVNDAISLQNCDNTLNQKWYPFKDNYISSLNHKCLSNNNGKIIREKCNDSNIQKWHTDNYNYVIDKSQESVEPWRTRTGKRLILIEPDTPWYINKNKNIQKGLIKLVKRELNKKEYRDNADFKSNFALNIYRPDMGYGYSYAQRHENTQKYLDSNDYNKSSPDDVVFENFDDTIPQKKINFNVITCSLLLLILLLIVVRYYLNNK